MQISDRLSLIKPSATLAISAKAAELKAQGKDIISLSSGEPDFDTPEPIQEVAIAAIKNGFTHYTPVDGIPELKTSIINKLTRENNLDYQPNQILVSCGVKHSLYNLFVALLNSGDEVIIPGPYWVSYPDMVLLAEGKPVIIDTNIEQQFKITPAQLKAAITDKTRCIVMNSPSNPTGVAYTRAELKALGDILKQHPNIVVVSDDIYEHILWGQDSFCNIVNACPELYQQSVVMNGVSKAYAMTGWRIGFAAGPKELIAAMKKIQSQSTSNPTSIAQKASVAAFDSGTTLLGDMIAAFKRRHDFMIPALNAIEGFNCLPADGTFYAFPNVEKVLAQKPELADDVALSAALLEHAGVATVPGTAFGAPGYLRLSYAISVEKLEQAVEKIKAYLA